MAILIVTSALYLSRSVTLLQENIKCMLLMVRFFINMYLTTHNIGSISNFTPDKISSRQISKNKTLQKDV